MCSSDLAPCRACIRSAHAKISSLDFAGSLLVRYILRTKKRSFRMEAVNRREFLAIAAAIPPLMQSNPAVQTNRIGTTSMNEISSQFEFGSRCLPIFARNAFTSAIHFRGSRPSRRMICSISCLVWSSARLNKDANFKRASFI